jgi:chromosome partitioning protein
MNIFTIINNKGGVGKSTAAQNIGAAIAKFTDSKTLLIDLDPQASLTKSFGINLQSGQPTVGSFILGKSTIEQTAITYKKSNIDILPASSALVQEQEKIKNNSKFPFSLIRALEKVQSKKQYQFIVIDCPPSTSALTDIALIACQRYYVPLQAEYFSYEGLRELVNYANQIASLNPGIKLGGVFANRFNPNAKNNFSREIIERVKDQLEDKFLKTYIRENIAISIAQANFMPIFDYDIKSNGDQDYYNLTKEIITI